MNVAQSKTYHKVLMHRRYCKKWGKKFCLECFGGGLTLFSREINEEYNGKAKKKKTTSEKKIERNDWGPDTYDNYI